jgi:hypothetical protein
MIHHGGTGRRRKLTVLVILGLSLMPPGWGMGQEIVEYTKVFRVRSMQGEVKDPSGAGVPGVTVQEMDKDWKATLRKTKTDDRGRFEFAGSGQGVHYLQFKSDGFNQVRMKVRIARWRAKKLIVRLPVAT